MNLCAFARMFPGKPDRKVYMRKYDAQHQTSDDYTLMLEDVPREASEVGSHSGIVGLPGLGITLGLS